MTQIKTWFTYIKYAFGIAQSYCKAYVWGCVILKSLANTLRFVFNVYFISYLLKVLINQPTWKQVFMACLFGIVLVTIRIVLENISDYFDYVIGVKISPCIRKELYKNSLLYDLNQYQNKEYFDQYSMVLKNGSQYIQKSIIIITNLLSMLVYCIFFITGLFTLDIVVMGLLIVLLIYHFFVFSIQHKKFADLIYKHECIQQPFVRKNDYFKRIFYLKSFAYDLKDNKTYHRVMDVYNRDMKEWADARNKCKKKEFIWNVLVNGYGNLYSNLIVVALLVIVLKYRGINDISVYWQSYALFIQFYGLYFFQMSGELTALSNHMRQFQDFQSKQRKENENAKIEQAPEILVNNLSFHYDENHSFKLNSINLRIKKGEKVAIVGRNGSGKTTLFKLMLGMLQPVCGEVLFNGKSVKEYNFIDENNQLGLLCQNFNLYSVSIKDNITMGVNSYSDEQVKDAACMAQCDDFLNTLSAGLDTMLGQDIYENAVELSGGQSQRIALARVFLNKIPLVFMDEPTAYIDPIFEKNIIENLIKVFKDKTTVMISHRLDVTKYFDRIIVMNQGQIAEEGTFKELMEKQTLFRDMYRYQMGE